MKDLKIGYIKIYEDWNERDGNIYYRWKNADEDEWHERLTAYESKPTIQFTYISPQQYGKLLAKTKSVNGVTNKRKHDI